MFSLATTRNFSRSSSKNETLSCSTKEKYFDVLLLTYLYSKEYFEWAGPHAPLISTVYRALYSVYVPVPLVEIIMGQLRED